jgi:hypothetical protein
MDSYPMIRSNEIAHEDNAAYWDTVRRSRYIHPEQDLMLAVLEDALLNYWNNLDSPRKAVYDDREWFFGFENNCLFSFESICMILGLNPQRVRKRLLDWESEARMRTDAQ